MDTSLPTRRGVALRLQLLFWGAVLIPAGILLWLLSAILLPFFLGVLLAYLLAPAAGCLQRWGLPRWLATALPLLFFFSLLTAGALLLLPLVVTQISRLIVQLPQYFTIVWNTLQPWAQGVLQHPGAPLPLHPEQWVNPTLHAAEKVLTEGLSFLTLLALMAITPPITVYLLYSWPHMLATVDSWLPRPYAEEIRTICSEIDRAMSGYLRGAGLVCVALAALYGTSLSLLGLPYGLTIGLLAGLLSFIPFLGTATGLLGGLSMVLVQWGWSWGYGATVLGIFIGGQLIADHVLSPCLIGGRVGLHPLWILFGVLAGGKLFGVLGVLLAVPMTATLGVILRHGMRRYVQSPLYTGETSSP